MNQRAPITGIIDSSATLSGRLVILRPISLEDYPILKLGVEIEREYGVYFCDHVPDMRTLTLRDVAEFVWQSSERTRSR
jgi:hypothetical protein